MRGEYILHILYQSDVTWSPSNTVEQVIKSIVHEYKLASEITRSHKQTPFSFILIWFGQQMLYAYSTWILSMHKIKSLDILLQGEKYELCKLSGFTDNYTTLPKECR